MIAAVYLRCFTDLSTGHGICSNGTMRRTSRRFVAVLTLLGFFGFQWAVAAHACANVFDPSGGLMPAAVSQSSSSDCTKMNLKQNQLPVKVCLEHCTKGKDASSSVASTDAPAPASVAFLTVQPAVAVEIANSWSSPQLQARNNTPPPLVLSQRLRI